MTKVLQVMAGGDIGGAEEFFMRLVPALTNAGTKQRVILRRHEQRQELLNNLAIPITTCRFGGMFDFRTRIRIRSELASFQPDLVMAWMNRAAQFSPKGDHVLAARIGGYYNLKYYRHCDHLIGNTLAIRDYLTKHGWPEKRAWYIPNFADNNRAKPIERDSQNTPKKVPNIPKVARLAAAPLTIDLIFVLLLLMKKRERKK